jgi:hypothetical protein
MMTLSDLSALARWTAKATMMMVIWIIANVAIIFFLPVSA